MLALAVICFGKAFVLTPTLPDSDATFREHYQKQVEYRRTSLTRLVPEIDQLKLGSYLFIDSKQAKVLRRVICEVSSELRTDSDFQDSSSALGMAYDAYEYRPENAQGDVLIFLHGSLGNFKGYVWSLKETADASGMTILATSYGMGNWQHDEGCSRLAQMRAYCQNEEALNNKRLFLGGISNGGRGCLRAVQQFGNTFTGISLISPVMEDHLINSTSFQLRSPNLPFLILHGTRDRRIPIDFVRRSMKLLENRGANVDLRSWESEDHFLMFHRRDELENVLTPWIQSQESAGETSENL